MSPESLPKLSPLSSTDMPAEVDLEQQKPAFLRESNFAVQTSTVWGQTDDYGDGD